MASQQLYQGGVLLRKGQKMLGKQLNLYFNAILLKIFVFHSQFSK